MRGQSGGVMGEGLVKGGGGWSQGERAGMKGKRDGIVERGEKGIDGERMRTG